MNESTDFLKILSILREGCSCCNCKHFIMSKRFNDCKAICLERDNELSLADICKNWAWKEDFILAGSPALLKYIKGDECENQMGRDQSRL